MEPNESGWAWLLKAIGMVVLLLLFNGVVVWPLGPIARAIGFVLSLWFFLTLIGGPVLLALQLLTRNVEPAHRKAHLSLSPIDQHRLFADHFRREQRIEVVDTAPDGRPCVTVDNTYETDELWRVPVPIEKAKTANGWRVTVLPKAAPVPEGEAAWLIGYDTRVRELRATAATADELWFANALEQKLARLKRMYRDSAKPHLDPSGTRIQDPVTATAPHTDDS